MEYFVEIGGYSELSTWQQEHLRKTHKAIKNGDMYAKIESVSRAGNVRRIKFYYKDHLMFIRATDAVDYLRWNYVWHYDANDSGLKVLGNEGDMVINTLFHCMEYKDAKNWDQKYNTL